MYKSIRLFIVTMFFLILSYEAVFCTGKAINAKEGPGQCRVIISNLAVNVELADTNQRRTKGLSGRRELKKNDGMLFIFPKTGKYTFWMKGCYIDLDIAFINTDGIILEIFSMKKEPVNMPDEYLRTYTSHSDRIKYALELNYGWFKENNTKTGRKITILSH
jgi:hypothetical protein